MRDVLIEKEEQNDNYLKIFGYINKIAYLCKLFFEFLQKLCSEYVFE